MDLSAWIQLSIFVVILLPKRQFVTANKCSVLWSPFQGSTILKLVKEGIFIKDDRIVLFSVSSLIQCYNICFSSTICQSINFKESGASKELNCALIPKVDQEGTSYEPRIGWRLYEKLSLGCTYDSNCNPFENVCYAVDNLRSFECSKLTNVALRKPTMQSGIRGGGYSSRAVDGIKTTNYYSGSCSHTKILDNQWWRVDLQDIYYVRSVSVTNRGDCCYTRLSNFEIHVGDKLIDNGNVNPLCNETGLSVGSGKTVTFYCQQHNSKGQYVNILSKLSETPLTLCEVEVWGVLTKNTCF